MGRISYDLTWYYIALRNLLVTKRISEEIFSGINAGKSSHYGMESMIRINLLSPEIREKTEAILTSSLTVSANRFIDFTDNNIDYSGKKLPGIPSATSYNELRLKLLNSIEFAVIHKFSGKQFMNDSNTKELENWQVTDLQFGYSKQFENKKVSIKIYGGAKNLFDSKYASMILVNAPSFGSAEPRYYYPGLPRNYFAGIAIGFN